jgi:hypothetical protein
MCLGSLDEHINRGIARWWRIGQAEQHFAVGPGVLGYVIVESPYEVTVTEV